MGAVRRRLGRRLIASTLVLVAGVMAAGGPTAAETGAGTPAPAAVPAEVVPGQYIVRFAAATSTKTMTTSILSADLEVAEVYTHVFSGALVRGSDAEIADLRDDPRVLSVEPDAITQVVEGPTDPADIEADAVQNQPTWGLDRIDQRNLPLSSTYSYPATGSGVTAYIIDTGIRSDHNEVIGRVASGYDAVGGGTEDCAGHGTHVAGTVGGSTYGVAKGVTLRPVRVLGCDGKGTSSYFVSGANWAIANHAAGTPAVANISLATIGGTNDAMDAATQSLINDGISVAVAAGNENVLASTSSPARVAAAVTVGATDSSDARASFSNYGASVDLFAPGVSITSSWYTSASATNTISGTSMATPHVAGAAAVLLSQNPTWTPSQVASKLIANSTANLVTNPGSGSPNRLLYSPPPVQVGPVNDAFASATSFSLTGPSPLSGSNANATIESGEPNHATRVPSHSVWWKFIAPSDGSVTLATAGSSFDTLLAAYTGTSVSGLTEVASNDDDPAVSDQSSKITFSATAGTTYRVAVDGYNTASGSISLGITWAPSGPVAPANDNLAAATTMSLTGSSPLSGANDAATIETDEPNHATRVPSHSVWWKFTAPSNGTVTMSTRGSSFDTLLAVYTGSAMAGLTEVGSNDDNPDNLDQTSIAAFAVTSGTTYRVAVDGYGSATGTIEVGFTWTAASSGGPANDDFASATSFSLTGPNPLSGNNTGATLETGEPNHAARVPAHSIWWRFTAPSSGTVSLSTGGTAFDTLLAVYTGTTVSGLTEIRSNDDNLAAPDRTSLVTFPVTSGTTYRVAIDGFVGATGPTKLGFSWSPAGTKGSAPFASWDEFVERQYVDLTGTLPSTASRSQWATALSNGTSAEGDLIESLRRSSDNTTHLDPTTRLYRAFLGRGPDAGGLRFWVGRHRTGNWTLNKMADSFSSSSEFKTKYGSMTNRQFVVRIYTDVLGRAADTEGVNYWTGKLDSKSKSRGQVMVGFSESSEYKGKQAENTDVAIAYIYLLGRAPTADETSNWVARQKAGTNQSILATELLNSLGYANHIT